MCYCPVFRLWSWHCSHSQLVRKLEIRDCNNELCKGSAAHSHQGVCNCSQKYNGDHITIYPLQSACSECHENWWGTDYNDGMKNVEPSRSKMIAICSKTWKYKSTGM